MPIIKNFEEARRALRPLYDKYAGMPKGTAYTLDRIKVVLAACGNPQDTLRVFHVAGTSGKTSTAYYTAALLEATGATVGLTVSPHVIEMNERIQINRTPLSEDEYCAALSLFMDLVAGTGVSLTYFELQVALMFHELAKRQVDYAVVEVGLGGLMDATNVVSREDKVCIITDIGLDHTSVLGKTIPEIAAQKAGIIQPQNQAFMYDQGPEVIDVVTSRCTRQNAALHLITEQSAFDVSAALPLFQRRNLHLAEQAVTYVLDRDGRSALTQAQFTAAAETYIPGRMDIVQSGGKTIIFDGAHNEQKMTTLLASIAAAFPDKPLAALVAFSGNDRERWRDALNHVTSAAAHIIVTSFDLEPDDRIKTSLPASEVAAYLASQAYAAYEVYPELAKACEVLLQRPEPVLLVTGSFYMLHPAREILHL